MMAVQKWTIASSRIWGLIKKAHTAFIIRSQVLACFRKDFCLF